VVIESVQIKCSKKVNDAMVADNAPDDRAPLHFPGDHRTQRLPKGPPETAQQNVHPTER